MTAPAAQLSLDGADRLVARLADRRAPLGMAEPASSLFALRGAPRLAPVKLIAVAPPVVGYELGEVTAPDCDWMLAQGDADDVVPPDAVLSWAAAQPHPPRLHVLHGAGHFFHGRLHELKPLVLDFLKA